jgi:carbonic anhydrase/acetyltransferase-like protein (isoleucine patch superfamily)
MPIYALGDVEPEIHPDAYVHPDAVVIGAVTLRAGVSIWPTAVLRADGGRIEVGEGSNIQDGSIVHCTRVHATLIGVGCTLGHNVHIEGVTVGDGALIASGSVVLNGSVVEEGAIVGAGAVVPPNSRIPARRLALGVPARVRDGYEVPEGAGQVRIARYRDLAKRYRAELRLVAPR